ncbi:DUF4190 domain-containing protein [Ornithinimicrobium avium]|uniref:DUF4190 domain-containing protein n=1 Tax=Ornithinimicrobium avium TaxID=2283195 RepID=A0A345NSL8_9MICO|nr:DUF4190 domain-containing protein [Ornithinimicrobium avium]
MDPYASPAEGYRPGPAPAAPWGPPAQNLHPRGTTILVLGILSVTFMQILGPFAWVMGHRALREIDASGRPYINGSSIRAGMILGIIGTVLGLIGLLWMMVILGALLASA